MEIYFFLKNVMILLQLVFEIFFHAKVLHQHLSRKKCQKKTLDKFNKGFKFTFQKPKTKPGTFLI